MNAANVPFVRAAPDAMRHGFHSASEDVRPVHEVQRLQTYHRRTNWELKMATVEQVYGKAASMRLRTEKAVMEQFVRLPGLASSRAGLDTITGDDEQLSFNDFLNDPNEHPEHTFKVHETMEVKLGIF
ncbi:TPA: hypothetical protein N0F65_003879 [Lagenidium giganteum]|uniref:Proteasome maturation factor UMP1 n=1 Tax=Lagenidium giganteum TaxID=4803 RepID=A0AAV2ZAS0_9STRA|nr:TPA: hypothetical protein N0F65_003879 [Lagenidium giganteum]